MQNILLFFQNTAVAEKVAEKAVEQESVFELIAHSTFGLLIMVCLFFMSIIAVSIFVSRYATIKRATQIDEGFMNNIRAHVQNGNIGAARALCQSTDSPIARMVEKGLMRIGKPLDDIEHAIENVGKLEVFKLEKQVNVLAIIAGIAPMFGFLGTIAGMITTFQDLSTKDNLSISAISGGIYIKMYTSAFGLIVGIFSFVAFNILNNMIDRVVHNMETSTFNFIDLLQEPAG